MPRTLIVLPIVTCLVAIGIWFTYDLLSSERCPDGKKVTVESSASDGDSWTITMNIPPGSVLALTEFNQQTSTSRNLSQPLIISKQTCRIKVSVNRIDGINLIDDNRTKIGATIRTFDRHGNVLDSRYEVIANPVYPAIYTASCIDSTSDTKTVELFMWKRQLPDEKPEFFAMQLCVN